MSRHDKSSAKRSTSRETQAALTFPPRFLNIQGNSSSHSWVSL